MLQNLGVVPYLHQSLQRLADHLSDNGILGSGQQGNQLN